MGPYELLEKIVDVLERLRIPYLVTGSVAVMAYGEPRPLLGHDLQAGQQKKISTGNGTTIAYGHTSRLEISGFETQEVVVKRFD